MFFQFFSSEPRCGQSTVSNAFYSTLRFVIEQTISTKVRMRSLKMSLLLMQASTLLQFSVEVGQIKFVDTLDGRKFFDNFDEFGFVSLCRANMLRGRVSN